MDRERILYYFSFIDWLVNNARPLLQQLSVVVLSLMSMYRDISAFY